VVASGHLWYNSGTNSRVRVAPHSQGVHSTRRSISPLDLRQWLPAHPYYRQSAHFYFSASGLSWATRLHNQIELSGQLSDRHAFNMTWGRTMNRSLTDIDGDRSTPKTSMSCCFSIDIPPHIHLLLTYDYFHDSKYSKPCFSIHLYLIGDRKSPDFYRSKHC